MICAPVGIPAHWPSGSETSSIMLTSCYFTRVMAWEFWTPLQITQGRSFWGLCSIVPSLGR